MKRVSLIFILTLVSTFVFAQTKFHVTGQIKDRTSKEPLEFCSVQISSLTDSTFSTGTVTNNKGFFSFDLNPGNYKMVLSFIGYVSDTILMPIGSDKFVGVYKLKRDINTFEEVQVKSASSENQLDRDVQVVTDKMKVGAADAKDVLDKVNGVDIDRYTNSVKVDNDANIIILVDGLEKDQEYIKNLAPDRLKKIEVIRDPGGKYALRGYSAVINIILKKDYQGVDLFLHDEAMVDPDAKLSSDIPLTNGVSGTVNYTYNKINLYAKYSRHDNNFNITSYITKYYKNDGLHVISEPAHGDTANTHIRQTYNRATFGVDYRLNPKHTLSYEGNWSPQPHGGNINDEIYRVTYLQHDSTLYQFLTQTKNISHSTNTYNSLFYVGNLDSNNVLNATFTYYNSHDTFKNYYFQDSEMLRDEAGSNNTNNTKFNFEYTHIFKNKTSLMTGYGNTWKRTNSLYTSEVQNMDFTYSDLRNQLYAYYTVRFSKKLSLQIGGAGESSAPVSDTIRHNYFVLQPYIDFKYKVNKMLSLKLKYRSRSNYPSSGQTNPFVTTIDQQSVRIGNPLLKPEVTHRISLQTDILGGLITLEPYYHFSSNMITETGTLCPDSIFEYNYSNAGFYQNYGLKARMTVPFGKSLFLQSDFDFYHSSIDYDNHTNNVRDWTMMTQLIYQNQKSGAFVGLQYQNNLRKFITAQGYSKGDNDFWILFAQHPFMKKKLTVMLLYFLPVSWGVDFNQGGYINTDTYTEDKNYNISLLKNIVMVQLSYRFNKGKSVKKREKNVEIEDGNKSKGIF